MKKCFRFSFLLVFYLISLSSFLQSQTFTNCFYDNHKTEKLKTNPIFVDGELENSGFFNPEGLKLHSVIVKESSFDQDLNINFIGAYRYDGYSLKEILDPFVLKKKNANEFPPEVDLYVEVSNDNGDKIILSWGEIFYPNKLNQIIVAVQVMPIIPEKTKDQWPLTTSSKLIVSNDLVSARNISNPSKITVKSAVVNAVIEKGGSLEDAKAISLHVNNEFKSNIYEFPDVCLPLSLHTIFYGKGRGLHSTNAFTGCNLKSIIESYLSVNTNVLKGGKVVFVSQDGYRAVFSLSELCNRNDQEYAILILNDSKDSKGMFRVFPSSDFFSDRSVKGIKEIFIEF